MEYRFFPLIKRDQQLSTKESSDPRLIFQLFDMLARYQAAQRLKVSLNEHLSQSSHPY
jgi:hypothetical protein